MEHETDYDPAYCRRFEKQAFEARLGSLAHGATIVRAINAVAPALIERIPILPRAFCQVLAHLADVVAILAGRRVAAC